MGASSPSGGIRSASSAISRIAVSIVPSTGWRTAQYARVAASRSAAAASAGPSSPSVAASASASPRTIWLRITPLLPRAPISAACFAAWATPARSASAREGSASASASAATDSARLVPVSPSGTG